MTNRIKEVVRLPLLLIALLKLNGFSYNEFDWWPWKYDTSKIIKIKKKLREVDLMIKNGDEFGNHFLLEKAYHETTNDNYIL